MKKERRLAIEANISSGVDDLSQTEYLFHLLIYEPMARFLGLFILLIFTLFNYDKISKLATITSDSLFNHVLTLGPAGYMVFLVGTIIFFVVFTVVFYILKEYQQKNKKAILKKMYTVYKVYDFITFALSTIIIIYFIIMFLITPCSIEGSSMENTYYEGDRVMVWHLGYNPNSNDVVILDSSPYTYSNLKKEFYIKRIVAKEDDEISFVKNEANNYYSLYVNENLIEDIIKTSEVEKILGINSMSNYTLGEAYIIPKGKALVLGDNRAVSKDSRALGLISYEDIVGVVVFRFFPFDRIGMPNPSIK